MSSNEQRSIIERRAQEREELSTFLIKGGIHFAKKHYVISSMYVIGMILLFFVTGFAVTREREIEYQTDVSAIDFEKLSHAETQVYTWYQRYVNSKGLFSCNSLCTQNYNNFMSAKKDLEKLQATYAKVESDAKAKVGLFSEYGVQDAKNLFWDQMAAGKGFAKRSSWYDLLFMGISAMGRDESLGEFIVRFLLNVLMNFTIGLAGALIGFYWYIWGIISSYQANFWASLIFYAFACIAATSFVATYILGMYATAAGAVYVAVRAAGPALEDQRRRREEYLRNHPNQYYDRRQRPHAD